MWVKICGTTSYEDAQAAVDAGANALGFVFAESPRRVTVAEVAEITRRLPKTVEKFGVFVDAGFDEIVESVLQAGLTGVQLHGAGAAGDGLALRLRERFAEGAPHSGRLGILRVLHYDATLPEQLAELQRDHAVDAVLVDSRTTQAQGGTGIRFDWQAASKSVVAAAPHLRIVVAGGLSPANVQEAIYTLQPWGVDVVTGVEAAPGRKDAARMKQFVAAARAAFLIARAAKMAEA
jgi:phosphoribosylanthranilate isomerase